jgi:F0F1-type ATP synthase membrane subunit b/b'
VRTEQFAAEAAERQRQLAQALAQQTKAAEQEIVAAKERAFSEIRNVAVEVARSVTEKLTGSAPDEAKIIPAVDRAMAERAG